MAFIDAATAIGTAVGKALDWLKGKKDEEKAKSDQLDKDIADAEKDRPSWPTGGPPVGKPGSSKP